MKEKQNVSPDSLRGTNSNEPSFSRTRSWLEQQHQQGSWHQLPPVYAIDADGEEWVLDGNHRRDYAEENNLPLPSVITLENDDDLLAVKERLGTSYRKITRLEQLRRMLEGRIK